MRTGRVALGPDPGKRTGSEAGGHSGSARTRRSPEHGHTQRRRQTPSGPAQSQMAAARRPESDGFPAEEARNLRFASGNRQKPHPGRPFGGSALRPPAGPVYSILGEAGPPPLADQACRACGPGKDDGGGAQQPGPRPAIPAPGRPAACAQRARSPGWPAAAPRRAAPRTRPESSSRSSRRCRGEGGGSGVAILQRRRRGSMAPRGRGLGAGSGLRVGSSGGSWGGRRGKRRRRPRRRRRKRKGTGGGADAAARIRDGGAGEAQIGRAHV